MLINLLIRSTDVLFSNLRLLIHALLHGLAVVDLRPPIHGLFSRHAVFRFQSRSNSLISKLDNMKLGHQRPHLLGSSPADLAIDLVGDTYLELDAVVEDKSSL